MGTYQVVANQSSQLDFGGDQVAHRNQYLIPYSLLETIEPMMCEFSKQTCNAQKNTT